MARVYLTALFLLFTLFWAEANQERLALRITRFNPAGRQPYELTCKDFGLTSHDCHLSFNVCVGGIEANKINVCDLVDTDFIIPNDVTSFPIGDIIDIEDQKVNKIPENIGIRVQITDLKQLRKVLFTFEKNFKADARMMGVMQNNGTILQLDYMFYKYCVKNYFGANCDVFCTQTHSSKCDRNGNPICTLKCDADESCVWDKNEDQYHCECDPTKGCGDKQKYHRICKLDFCHFGHKSCFRKSGLCMCEMENMKPSYCHYDQPLRTLPPNRNYPTTTTTVSPDSAPQSSGSSGNAIVICAILFAILMLILSVVFGIKMAKYRRASKKFKYGPMRSTHGRNVANDMDNEFSIPSRANVDYSPNRSKVIPDHEDQEDIFHNEHKSGDKDPIIMP